MYLIVHIFSIYEQICWSIEEVCFLRIGEPIIEMDTAANFFLRNNLCVK